MWGPRRGTRRGPRRPAACRTPPPAGAPPRTAASRARPSSFRDSSCSRLTRDGGRITLRDHTLITTSADGDRTEKGLASDEEVRAVYRAEFGIVLDRLPVPLHPRD
ncbi:arylamine N-acetyltransferase [Streptomyces katrae]|uniref:arylamine N-acetyltransferase n=1 Tax=Streptomyces katrae TaxID=68223 RepID=UPI0009A526B6|nr:arylamine N-acetyltransferase [Streptomyces katrae]